MTEQSNEKGEKNAVEEANTDQDTKQLLATTLACAAL
jgi:hypothetical protein